MKFGMAFDSRTMKRAKVEQPSTFHVGVDLLLHDVC